MRAHVMIVAFLLLAGAVFYGVGEFANRYLEINRFPEKKLSYTISELRSLATDKSGAAGRYVMPVLFPLDLFVMILLGGAMAVASLFWARSAGLPADALWIVLVLPVSYVAVDLGEDSILALMLTYPETITDSLASTLKGLTIVKLGCVTAAAAQTLGFLILSVGKAAAGHF